MTVFRRFTESAREVVSRAQDEARRLGHAEVGTEHLLLGVLAAPWTGGARALLEFDVTLEEAREQVRRVGRSSLAGAGEEIPFSPRAKAALEHALREALSGEDDVIEPEHLLLGTVEDPGSEAARLLADFDIDKHSVRAALAAIRSGDDFDATVGFVAPSERLVPVGPATPAATFPVPPVAAIVCAATAFPLGLITGFVWGRSRRH